LLPVGKGGQKGATQLSMVAVETMDTLTEVNPNARELLTEILDKTRCGSTLSLIVNFLRSKRVERVRIKFGFALDRDLEGKPQAPGQIVQLDDLEAVIKRPFVFAFEL
jgi:hypothetical protein